MVDTLVVFCRWSRRNAKSSFQLARRWPFVVKCCKSRTRSDSIFCCVVHIKCTSGQLCTDFSFRRQASITSGYITLRPNLGGVPHESPEFGGVLGSYRQNKVLKVCLFEYLPKNPPWHLTVAFSHPAKFRCQALFSTLLGSQESIHASFKFN